MYLSPLGSPPACRRRCIFWSKSDLLSSISPHPKHLRTQQMSDCEHEITAKCRFLDLGESIITVGFQHAEPDQGEPLSPPAPLSWLPAAALLPSPSCRLLTHCYAEQAVCSDCSYSPRPFPALRSTSQHPAPAWARRAPAPCWTLTRRSCHRAHVGSHKAVLAGTCARCITSTQTGSQLGSGKKIYIVIAQPATIYSLPTSPWLLLLKLQAKGTSLGHTATDQSTGNAFLTEKFYVTPFIIPNITCEQIYFLYL